MSGSEPAVSTASTFCATVDDEWVRAGVTDAVVAPGSRSTPMALALAGDDRLRLHVHPDERSAGFVALGLARATGRPAVVLTTSGTAAVELHPAVVEAHEDKVPMLVCTADRPPELHGVGAPQTIDQQQLYGRSVRAFLDAGVPDPTMSDSWRAWASRAFVRAVSRPPGPVHLNLPFRDPLTGRAGPLPTGRDQQRPWRRAPLAAVALDDDTLDSLAGELAGRTGVIVAGGGIGEPGGVAALAGALGWPVLADPRSGCRRPDASTISHFDAVLRVPSAASGLAPEVVLRLGSSPASKVLAGWLAGLDAWQVGIETDGTRYDPDATLDALLAAPPGPTAARLAVLVEQAASAPPVEPTDEADEVREFRDAWIRADAVAAEAIAAVLGAHPEPTEPAIARVVMQAVPDGTTLVVSSSMPIRDVEWFAAPRRGVEVLANRGANGIDGVVSTAAGVALARSSRAAERPGSGGVARRAPDATGPTALLIGDVALLHDTNGLLGAARRQIDLTIVVVDNDGGGIFSFLPQADSVDPDRFETLFGTPHGVDLAGLAAAHGIGSRRVERQDELGAAVAESMALGGVHLIIVPTDRAANVAVHREIDTAVAAALPD